MANVSGATNFFTKAAENSAVLSLTSSISSGATTVPVTGLGTNYADGDVVSLVIEPNSTNGAKQVFTGTVSGGATAVSGASWTEGTNQAHTAGVTIIDYTTATDWDLLQKGITTQHTQAGTHHAVTTDTLTASASVTSPSFIENTTSLQTVRSESHKDFIVDGTGIWSVSSGLTGAMTAITAYIGGKRVSAGTISSHTFAASSDTYVAIDNTGAITYSAVASGGTSPARPANAVWIALVRTSGSAIITFGQTPDPVNGLSCFDNLNNFPINPQRGSRVVGRQCGWGTITQGTSTAAVMWNGCQYLPFTGFFGRTYRFTMHESVIDSYTVSGSGGFFQWFFSNSQTKTVSSTMQVIRTPAVAGGCGADGTFEFVASYSGLQYLAIQWLSAPNVSGTLACERANSSAPAYYTVEEI